MAYRNVAFKKIVSYIGGKENPPKTKNILNDLPATIDLNIDECAYHVTSIKGSCFNKEQEKIIDNHIRDLNMVSDVKNFDIESVKKKLNCDTQKCVASKIGIDTASIFKPIGPANDTALLSNLDIDAVLQQFELKFTSFKFLHFTMDDWYNKSQNSGDIIKLSSSPLFINNIINSGKNCIGFIMNTDLWSGAGIHWTAMFIDMRSTTMWSVEFFNSSGNRPSNNIKLLIDAIINNLYLCNAKPYDCAVQYMLVTKNEHQLSSTECGLYSLFMIYNRCRNISLKYFENNTYDKIYDDTMVLFRKYLFWDK